MESWSFAPAAAEGVKRNRRQTARHARRNETPDASPEQARSIILHPVWRTREEDREGVSEDLARPPLLPVDEKFAVAPRSKNLRSAHEPGLPERIGKFQRHAGHQDSLV